MATNSKIIMDGLTFDDVRVPFFVSTHSIKKYLPLEIYPYPLRKSHLFLHISSAYTTLQFYSNN